MPKRTGFGIAKRLGSEGARVALVDVMPNTQAERELRDLGVDVISVQANVTDHNQVKAAVSSVVDVCLSPICFFLNTLFYFYFNYLFFFLNCLIIILF